ncbi:MAG: hypothetical protein JJE49_01645 [Peptostreptococcaceae bacterium]|nr:hypothetical protein [Peptostreptococcaceae bacterium]
MSNIVGTGMIRNREDGKNYIYKMQVLEPKNTDEILNLQHEILSALKNKEVCVYLSEIEVKEMIAGSGEMLGVFVNETLVAFGAILFPREREDNLGRDLGFKDEELMKVAHLEFAVVHPVYRDNSLQKKVAEYLVRKIIDDGSWNCIMNTISPYNPISLQTDFFLGLFIKKLSRKYDNVLRYILIYDINNPIKLETDTIISVPALDIIRQEELLKIGYYGVGFEDGTENERILFGKVVN